MQDRCPICRQFTELCEPRGDALDFCAQCGGILRVRYSRNLRRLDGRPLCMVEPVLRPAIVASNTNAAGSAEAEAPDRHDDRSTLDTPPPRLPEDVGPGALHLPTEHEPGAESPRPPGSSLLPWLMFIASAALGVLVTCGWYVLMQGIFGLAGR